MKKNLKILLIGLSVLVTILLGSLLGMILVYQKGFPQIKSLEDRRPNVMTAIYDENNQPIKEFAIEKRMILKSAEIPEILKHAIVVAEDRDFNSHWGINFRGFFRAVIGKILGKHWGGGSSITQQLARRLELTPEVTLSRKLKEMLLSIQIEKKYTKDQILTFYCNQMPFGASAYGVEAAAQYYFAKSARQVNAAEAALIAGILPNPNGIFHVFRHPDRALKRRNYVLLQMARMGYITPEEYQKSLQQPLPERAHDLNLESVGDYFSEEVRKYLDNRYGEELLYTGGLKVTTTLNMELQQWAESALREGLRALDKRRGWRSRNHYFNVLESKLDLKKFRPASWDRLRLEEGEVVEGVVMDVMPKQIVVRIGGFEGSLAAENAKWTRRPLQKLLKLGDVALFRIIKIDNKLKKAVLGIEQEPEVEGAILVVDNETGAIKAMVGGYSFERTKFNRATQSLRQPGSTFKPIIYTAALEHGFTPATQIDDAPFSYIDESTGELWEPPNFEEDYLGLLTMRKGLELSRNVVTARILQQITPDVGVQYAKMFGITSDIKPYMSMALGTFEVTMKEMVEAFTVFPNMGLRVSAYFIKGIRDLNDYIIEETHIEKKQVLEKGTAYIMNFLLQGVVQSGTGWRARALPAPLGGKTGTTNEFKDAWFIGFSPTVTVGVWVGFDQPRTLGKDETGSAAACPIFVSFMEKYLAKYPENRKFQPPPGLVFVEIDKYTGKRFQPGCLYPFREAFLPGTEPGPLEFCNEEEHQKVAIYYKKASDVSEDH